ncbi:MAG: hypothetical protein V7608_2589 [Hyphomicrobiales bacterium]|jgi:hypothetical protein
MSTRTIEVATDFSRFPGGRFRTDGPHSGEQFREERLVPALHGNDLVVVNLDGVAGFPSSFLEESFGGLVRLHKFSPEELEAKLSFTVLTPRMKSYPDMIRRYIDRAARSLEAA